LPALGLISYALWLGEREHLTIAACVRQFPLVAVGMAALLICAVSPRLPLRRIAILEAAFLASIAYSAKGQAPFAMEPLEDTSLG
jgi:hypothetical protein